MMKVCLSFTSMTEPIIDILQLHNLLSVAALWIIIITPQKTSRTANIANETSDVFILDGKLCFPVKCLGDQFVKETVVLFEPNAMSEHPLAKASKEQQCRRLGYFFASKLAKPQL